MPPRRFNDPPGTTEPPKRDFYKPFDPVVWVHTDCVAEECESGFIHSEDENQYSTVYGCPHCHKYREQIPTLKEWDGPLTLHDELAMARRLKERKDIHFSRDGRRDRAKEVVRGLGDMFGKTVK